MGRVEIFDGSLDGKTALVDTATGETNIKGKKIHDVRAHSPPGHHAARGARAERGGTKNLIAKHKRRAITNVWQPIGIPVKQWPPFIVNYSRVDP
ncbi:hypothetical protein NUW58_g393 [Xylaria curta]|uniref:Uncharacterized protein n=1 Tax=Xylaria curta TaxID=42375 RepID=A0ACC1PR57_9PEZI|nr:hypothetical protein NUW58_g393 [Xylaria curta]